MLDLSLPPRLEFAEVPVKRVTRPRSMSARAPKSITASRKLLFHSFDIQVHNLPITIPDENVYEMAVQYGPVSVCRAISRTPLSNYMISYSTIENARSAVQGFNRMTIEGRQLRAVSEMENGDDENESRASKIILVKRVSPHISEEELMRHFQRFGDILNTDVKRLESGLWRMKIEYPTIENAFNAVTEMNNQVIMQKTKPVLVVFSKAKKMKGREGGSKTTTNFLTMPHVRAKMFNRSPKH